MISMDVYTVGVITVLGPIGMSEDYFTLLVFDGDHVFILKLLQFNTSNHE